MGHSRRVYTLRSRLKKAREFYTIGKPWSRNLAWEILTDICGTHCGVQVYKVRAANAMAAGDTKEAFRQLGTAAARVIEDLEYAQEEGYSRDFDDWLTSQ